MQRGQIPETRRENTEPYARALVCASRATREGATPKLLAQSLLRARVRVIVEVSASALLARV